MEMRCWTCGICKKGIAECSDKQRRYSIVHHLKNAHPNQSAKARTESYSSHCETKRIQVMEGYGHKMVHISEEGLVCKNCRPHHSLNTRPHFKSGDSTCKPPDDPCKIQRPTTDRWEKISANSALREEWITKIQMSDKEVQFRDDAIRKAKMRKHMITGWTKGRIRKRERAYPMNPRKNRIRVEDKPLVRALRQHHHVPDGVRPWKVLTPLARAMQVHHYVLDGVRASNVRMRS